MLFNIHSILCLSFGHQENKGRTKKIPKLNFLHFYQRFRYSEDDVVGYLVQILQGVEYLHSRRILHLDLKPDNIMVTHLNAIKIVDFGSAQNFNPLSLRRQDAAAGLLEYTGEQWRVGRGEGVVLCDLLVSRLILLQLFIYCFPCCAFGCPAPEMVKGEVVGPPADIWTLGVVTHIM